MTIRNKILIYFSATVTMLTAVSFIAIYFLFAAYREEEFQQQQHEKIKYTVRMLVEYREMSENLADIMDELTIHDFYDERMLVFDKDKKLIFSSIDDLTITGYPEILHELNLHRRWIETKEQEYDVVGIYLEHNKKSYYAVSKAYDAFGYSKMYFLRNLLLAIFVSIVLVVLLVSVFLSNKISRPITRLANKLNKYDLNSRQFKELTEETSSHELKHLTERFNDLLQRTNEAFAFQQHTIHHISHQLKTPVAILVSELEKIKQDVRIPELKAVLEPQINNAKSLGNIINALLEISRIESGQPIRKQQIRMDEVIFDVIEELNIIYTDFHFEVNYKPASFDEHRLIISVNDMLIRQAVHNLLANCIAYSDNARAGILIDCASPDVLKILISNSGQQVSATEEKSLFNLFFRGANSQGKTGFGLGLALVKRILQLNAASITYFRPDEHNNVFELSFPLS